MGTKYGNEVITDRERAGDGGIWRRWLGAGSSEGVQYFQGFLTARLRVVHGVGLDVHGGELEEAVRNATVAALAVRMAEAHKACLKSLVRLFSVVARGWSASVWLTG